MFIIIVIIIIIITIIIIIIIVMIFEVIFLRWKFCNTFFSNSSFCVLSKNFEVMKLAVTRYDETNVDMHPF